MSNMMMADELKAMTMTKTQRQRQRQRQRRKTEKGKEVWSAAETKTDWGKARPSQWLNMPTLPACVFPQYKIQDNTQYTIQDDTNTQYAQYNTIHSTHIVQPMAQYAHPACVCVCSHNTHYNTRHNIEIHNTNTMNNTRNIIQRNTIHILAQYAHNTQYAKYNTKYTIQCIIHTI